MKRLAYLDILRILSAILVVCVHVSAMGWGDVPVNSGKWQVMNAYDCIGIVGVPLFFMISGAIYLNKNYTISVKKMWINKILRLFIVYHVCLVFFNFLPYMLGDKILNSEDIKEIIKQILLGKGTYHLWFIPELIMMYIISPILKEAFKNRKICEYYLILFFVVGGIFQSILLFDFPYKVFVSSYYDRSSLVMLTGYIGYFVLGHYINEFMPEVLSKKQKYILCVLLVIAMCIIIAGCGIDAVRKGEPSVLLNTPFTATHIIVCFSLFCLCKGIFMDEKVKHKNIAKSISKYTFGIYLVHPLVISILEKIGINTVYPHTVIMIPIVILIVFVLSGIISFLLGMIPGLRKLIV